ncbi:hypothetical protein FACS189494_09430 [Spirochaetia bacterium]|nr:hypothetical protein FACS189494_09430 [Spirochaetia bacterium]
MKYETLGNYIQPVDERNSISKALPLLGVSINKCFIPSVANIVGTDLSNYKIIRKNQFACSLMQVSRDEKIPIDCLTDYESAIVSPAYYVFEVSNIKKLLPQYLSMWFKRPEFDREASFLGVGGVRGSMTWNDFRGMRFPVPSLEKQKSMVKSYQVITDRILLKRRINDNLEAQIRASYSELTSFAGGRVGKLKDFVTTQYGFTASATNKNTGTRFLRITDIAQKFIDWSSVPFCNIPDHEMDKYQLQAGDIVVARTGATVGTAQIIGKLVPISVFASYLVRITPKLDEYKYLLGLSITSEEYRLFIQTNAGGSAQPQANAQLMTEFDVFIPPDKMINSFNEQVKPFFEVIELNQVEIARLNKLLETTVSSISIL